MRFIVQCNSLKVLGVAVYTMRLVWALLLEQHPSHRTQSTPPHSGPPTYYIKTIHHIAVTTLLRSWRWANDCLKHELIQRSIKLLLLHLVGHLFALFVSTYLLTVIYEIKLIPVATLSKVRVCGRSVSEIKVFESPRGHECLSHVSVVLSGRSLWVGLITHPQESHKCDVSQCDCVASIMRIPWPIRGYSLLGK
jgi:hypothetical protein